VPKLLAMQTISFMLSRNCGLEKQCWASSVNHTNGFSLSRRANTDCRMSDTTSACSSRRTLRAMFSPKQLTSTIFALSWSRRKSGAVFPERARRTPSEAKNDSMRRSMAAKVGFGTAANCRAK